MVLHLRPVGRGNWSTLRVEITGKRVAPRLAGRERVQLLGPMHQRVGDVVQLLGLEWRVVAVEAAA